MEAVNRRKVENKYKCWQDFFRKVVQLRGEEMKGENNWKTNGKESKIEKKRKICKFNLPEKVLKVLK